MITIKTDEEIKTMEQGGRLLAKIVKELEKMIKPGVTTKEIDRAAEALILKYNASPAFKGYGGFPSTICASVNSVVVHGVPSDYKLKEGDIFSLDIGLKLNGFFADMARTFLIGNKEDFYNERRLIKVTKKALKLGIKKLRPGNTIGDIGNTIQRYVESQGLNVIRDLCGHGIGRDLHEDPNILNYGKRHKGEKIKKGMVFCLEPMVTIGDWHLKNSSDGFGYETKDGSLSAHFEDMIAVTDKGPKILTSLN